MRVVLAIFLVGGLVIALAYIVGGRSQTPGPPAAIGMPEPTAQPAGPTSAPGLEPECPAGIGPEQIAPVPADVQAGVDRAWERIERWLTDSVPAGVVWNPPADDVAIVRAQRAAGAAFPPDLVASLRRHDGVRAAGFTFAPFYAPMSTGEIAADAAKLCAADSGWDGDGIPIARDNGGWYLYLDAAGQVREHTPGAEGGVAAQSYTRLLEATADVLEGRGTTAAAEARYRPVVDADGLLGWRLR
ncbi:SMI1/KNR4 family protein [Actinokineospora sp. NPDC004072]